MIAVILAAGKGSRLGNMTEQTPKSLLPLNNKTSLLDYNLQILNSLGASTIFIVTGFQSAKIEEHVKGIENVKCIFNPFWNHCNVLGSLYTALPYLEDDFLFLHADTLVGMATWETLVKTSGEFVIPYQKKTCGEEEMKVSIGPNNMLLNITKQMPSEEADGEFLGIAKFSMSSLEFVRNSSKRLLNKNLHLYMESVLEEAIFEKRDLVVFEIGDSDFVEVDFEEDYFLAKSIFGGN